MSDCQWVVNINVNDKSAFDVLHVLGPSLEGMLCSLEKRWSPLSGMVTVGANWSFSWFLIGLLWFAVGTSSYVESFCNDACHVHKWGIINSENIM